MGRRNKVILISFGSVIHSYLMPKPMKEAFLATIDQFPDVTFIWKYEKEEDRIADGHPNLVTGTWLPQTDILGNTKFCIYKWPYTLNSFLFNRMVAKKRYSPADSSHTSIIEASWRWSRRGVFEKPWGIEIKRVPSWFKSLPLRQPDPQKKLNWILLAMLFHSVSWLFGFNRST